MRDERTALTVAADLVVARWSLFDGQRTGHARGLVTVGAPPPACRGYRCEWQKVEKEPEEPRTAGPGMVQGFCAATDGTERSCK